jgi:hypothetical protein
MTDLLGIIVFNAVLFFSLILSLPASALAQQEVDPTYYESAAPQTASIEHSAKTANKDKAPKQVSKAHHRTKAHKQAARNKNAQSLVAKK